MKISIITITLNDLENLKNTTKSILSQNYNDFQWIIKDGNSTDGTKEFIQQLTQTNKNIEYINKKDSSLYDAMNQALPYIKGTYTLFLNGGDVFASPDTLQKVSMHIKNKGEYDFIYGDNIDVNQKGLEIYKNARNISYLKHSLPTSHQAIFYKSSIIKKYKYQSKYSIAADYALTAQIYYDGNSSYKKLDFAICKFYLDGTSFINRKDLLDQGYDIHIRIVKNNKALAKIKYYKRVLTFFLLGNTPYLYKTLRKLIG